MKLPELTKLEQDALVNALSNSFGNCTCRAVNGQVMYCDGHRFLGEVQAFGRDRTLTDRVSILAYYRRMATLWTSKEFGGAFKLQPEPMPEPDPLPDDLLGPPRQPAPGSPQQGDDTNKLPW